MWHDKQYGAALAAAPFFWLLLYILAGPSIDWNWPLQRPVAFLLPVLIYVVLEEAAFRGWLQGLLFEKTWGKATWCGISRANLVTSLVFVACHFLYHPPLWATAVFGPSLLFGYFRDSYGSITPSVVLHVFYNAGYFWLFGLS